MKHISRLAALSAIFVIVSGVAHAADSVLQDNSVDSHFAADNAPSVDPSAVKPDHAKAGIGDGMMGVRHKRAPSVPKSVFVPASVPRAPAPPASQNIVGKHDDGNK